MLMKIPNTQTGGHLRGFTLIDLLVVMATLALLAVVVMPALAGIQNKGGRLECANNLRQIGTASMIFAGENNGWLPVCTLGTANQGGARTNYFGALHFTRYVYYGGTPNTQITTNEPPIQGGGYQNLGYLFSAGLAGNGNIFYCPAMWGDSGGGANGYLPLLTTDSNGYILSSYFYNPRVLNPSVYFPIRKYQTASQLEPHRLFAVDSILAGGSSVVDGVTATGSGVNPSTIEHARDHGWNVLFSDGSVQFSRLPKNNNYYYNLIINQLTLTETAQSFIEYDQVFTWLEQDH
jgi:type II secretory pathway pseudopilin PulG